MAYRDVRGKLYLSDTLMFADANTSLSAGYDATTTPTNQVKIKASDGASSDFFGRAVAVGSGRICVGSYYDDDNGNSSGSAYIYDLNGTQLAKIKASDGATNDFFGYSISIGSDRIVVGAYKDADNGTRSGSAYIYDLNGTQLAKIKPSDGASFDNFSASIAVGCNRIISGSSSDGDNGSNSGSAYIFDLDGNQLAKIKASDGATTDYFGTTVAVGSGRIVVGATGDDDNGSNSGSAYIFDLDGNQLAKITASDGATNDQFGSSVAVGSGRIVVGAYGDADNGSLSGSAYIFDLNGTQIAKIKPADGASNEYFGASAAVKCGRILVGAFQDGDNGTYSGSAYIYDLNGTQIAKIKPSDGTVGDFFGRTVSIGSDHVVIGSFGDDDNGSMSGSAYIWTLPLNSTEILDVTDE